MYRASTPRGMKEFKTILGDNWGVDGNFIVSPVTDKHYGLSEPIKKLMQASLSNEKAAEKLRLIEQAPIDPTGKFFLIPDSDHPEWSHRVELAYPKFEWGNQRTFEFPQREFLVRTDSPYMGVQCFGEDEKSDLFKDAGNFLLHGFDPTTNDYQSLELADTLEDAWGMTQNTDRNYPMPALHYDKPAFIEIPIGEELGFKGMYAELQLRSDPDLGTSLDANLMDRFGRCLSASSLNFEHLIGFATDREVISEILEDRFEDLDGTLHNFKNSDFFEPETSEDLKEKLELLQDKRFIKLKTADEDYEIMITPSHQDSVRLLSGKRIHVGKDIPIEKLERYRGQDLIVGEEKGFSVTVKHIRGTMTEEAGCIPIDAQKMFDLITYGDYLDEAVFETKKRAPIFQDRVRTGEPASFNQLLAVSCQGKFDDIIYKHNRQISADTLIQKIGQSKTQSLKMS